MLLLLFNCETEEMKWYERSDQISQCGAVCCSEEVEEFWPSACWNSSLVVWELRLGGGSSARKSIEASPRLLFIRAQTLCILWAVLCLPEWLARVGIRGAVQKSPSALPSLFPGRFTENRLQHGQSLQDSSTPEALSCAGPQTYTLWQLCPYIWVWNVPCFNDLLLLRLLPKSRIPSIFFKSKQSVIADALFSVPQHACSWVNS